MDGVSAARSISIAASANTATSVDDTFHMTHADLLRALRDCYDNLQQRNIVDLGLVQSATLTRDTKAPGASVRGVPTRYIARITVLAPGSDGDRNAQLRAQIENRLAGLPDISRVEINMLPALFPILDAGRR